MSHPASGCLRHLGKFIPKYTVSHPDTALPSYFSTVACAVICDALIAMMKTIIIVF